MRNEHDANHALAQGQAWTTGKHWAAPAPRRAQVPQRQRRSVARAMSSLRAMFKAGK